LDANWTIDRTTKSNPAACFNGTWETDASILSGGTVDGVGPGTLNLLGAIARAENSQGTAGSILRVDGGWKVNCFGPVSDLATIAIIRGKVELKTIRDADFDAMIGQLAENIAYVNPSDGKFYQGSSARDGRDGTISINSSTDSPVPLWGLWGRLTLDRGRGEKLLVGAEVSGDIYKETGALVLAGDQPGKPGYKPLPSPQLSIIGDDQPVFGLVMDLNPEAAPLPIDCYVVQMPNTAAADMAALLDGLSRGERIESTGYYYLNADLSNDLVQKEISPYVAVENLRLLWSEEEGRIGLVLMSLNDDGTRGDGAFSSLNMTPTQYAKTCISGELAQLGCEVHWAFSRALEGHLKNFQRNGTFALGIHSRIHRDSGVDLSHRSTIGGGLIGQDVIKPLSPTALLRYGAYGAYARTDMHFSGKGAALGKTAQQTYALGAIFSALEGQTAKNLSQTIHATLGGGQVRNHTQRIDGNGNHFSARFGGSTTFFNVEGVRNLLRFNGFQLGPTAGLFCECHRQNGHLETSKAASGATSLVSVRHAMGTSLLGFNLERDLGCCGNSEECRGKFFARAGWRHRTRQHHTDILATVQGTPYGEFLALQRYGSRDTTALAFGLQGFINQRWSCSLQWHGDIGSGKTDHHGSAQICRAF
jgi:hypothetical protein